MDKAVYGTIIVQNALPDLLRCVESIYPHVDHIYIMDGGSTDGTVEWINKWKDVYGITLFQHPYDDQGDQRNRLLSEIPKGSWCLNIDQDEEVKCEGFRDFLNRISNDLEFGVGRDLPLTIAFPCINLVKDLKHYDQDNLHYFATKCFYNDRNVHFTHGYHMSICYFDTEQNVNAIPSPKDWVVKHYAYLDKDRIERSHKDAKRSYKENEFDSRNWKIIDLKEEWK